MSVGRFIKSLLPSFEKSRIQEDIKTIKEELGEASLSPYKAASEHFEDHKFTSEDNLSFDQLFNREVNVDRNIKGDNYVTTIYQASQRAMSTLYIVEKAIEDAFAKDVTAEGLTFARANLIRYVEVLYFFSRYSRRLLLWTYNNERLSHGKENIEPFSPAEYEWMTQNQRNFMQCVGVVSHSERKMKGLFVNIPDMVVIPDEEANVEQTIGKVKLDPLKMNFINPVLNPIYHIRMHYTDFMVARYKLAQEEKRALEYRLLSLKELNQGRSDPKLDQQIEYTENRVRKLNRKLSKMEED